MGQYAGRISAPGRTPPDPLQEVAQLRKEVRDTEPVLAENDPSGSGKDALLPKGRRLDSQIPLCDIQRLRLLFNSGPTPSQGAKAISDQL